jgi:hypothetical protein
VYLVVLSADEKSPLAPDTDEEKADEKAADKGKQKEAEKKAAAGHGENRPGGHRPAHKETSAGSKGHES